MQGKKTLIAQYGVYSTVSQNVQNKQKEVNVLSLLEMPEDLENPCSGAYEGSQLYCWAVLVIESQSPNVRDWKGHRKII